MDDAGLVAVFLVLHLVTLAAGGGLILLALRGGDGDEHPPWGDDGGGPPRDPPPRPLGGPPLLEATPARVRLRGPARLADVRSRPRRREPCEPRRPVPTGPANR
jgi:hypothetical protein